MNAEGFLFTVIGIIMANSFLLMSYTWKFLTTTYSCLPIHWRPPHNIARIVFDNRRRMNRRVREWAEILTCLWLGCIFLGISMFMNMCALVGISGPMIKNLWIGPYTWQNYNDGKIMLGIAIIFFVSGLLVIGIARLLQFLVFTRRKQNSILSVE